MGSQWRAASLADTAWRPPKGLTRAARAEEQNQAAGGPERRRLTWATRPVLASVYFRRAAGRRVYAYLRWSEAGRTREMFVCEVERHTRALNLAYAWKTVHDRHLLDEERPVSSPEEPSARRAVSWAVSEGVRRQMQANRSRDTKPELAVRSHVHGLGLRYRVNARPLPSSRRTADLVFTRARVAVFVDGCYWHGCPDHHRPARRNEEFWKQKIARNRERDEETSRQLRDADWTVIRVWEHEDPETAALRIYAAVSAARREAATPPG